MSTETAIGQQRRIQPQAPAISGRLAGAAGLIFAATLVADNLIRAGAPGQGASPAQVTEYFLHHRAAALVPLGLNTFGVALFPFAAGLWAGPGPNGPGGGQGRARWPRPRSPPCSGS